MDWKSILGLKKKEKKKKKGVVRDYVDSLIWALVAALILRTFVVQAFRIPTGSMEDTLLVGDFLLVNKFEYGVRTPDTIPLTGIKIPWTRLPAIRSPRPHDVVVFKYPRNPKLDYIKRCIAKGGDTVQVIQKKVYVNGKPFKDPPHVKYTNYYIPPGQIEYGIYPPGAGNRDNYGPVIVPPNSYFMMGDNRDNSSDSRYWGFMPHDNVLGEALIIYWSWDKTIPMYRFFRKVRWKRIGMLIH